ncbi:hypothetical protein G9A89_016074 [Geosiphon pyriformis]|nr:hypothetical protein G9A89_016074 [Geosiphon pyriformis]
MKIEKIGLVHNSGVISGLLCKVSSMFFDKIVRLLGIVKTFAISFGYYKPCYFFSGLNANFEKEVFVFYLTCYITFNIFQANNSFVVSLKAALNSIMSIKKGPKGALYGSVDSTFSQKKKVSVGNIKHSGDEKKILLVKPGVSEGMYLNMDSKYSDNEAGGFVVGSNSGFLLGSAASTPKAKKSNIGLISGPSVRVINFEIDKEIIKIQVEVSVKKSFALNINLLAVDGKSATAKT